MNLFEFYQVMSDIAGTSSRKDKEVILLRYKNDVNFCNWIHFLYNDLEVTGLSIKKVTKPVELGKGVGGSAFSMDDLLAYLRHNKTGSDKDIATVQEFIKEQVRIYTDTGLQQFLEQFFCKEFKSGLTAKTINKVYGKDFLPIFEVQLAKGFDDVEKEFVVGELLFGTLKLDGHRCVALVNTIDDIVFMSRSGHEMQGLVEVKRAIQENYGSLQTHLGCEGGFVLDGELLVTTTDRPVTEYFNETSKILRKEGIKTNITYHIFDTLPISEFLQGKSKANYGKRRELLELAFSGVENINLTLVELLYKGISIDEIKVISQDLIDKGEEGLMVNRDLPYECKRSKHILKLKGLITADLEIVGFEEGEKYSKYEGTLGKIIVDFKGQHVPVGSGLSDSLRHEIWNNKERYLGVIAEIYYTSDSVNQNDNNVSMRYARFKGFRFDKTVEDISYV